MQSTLRTFAAALLGGAIVAGALLLLGVGGSSKTTTILQQAPLIAGGDTSTATGSTKGTSPGLTPAQIYKAAAPGVVFIQSTIPAQTQSPFNVFPSTQQGEATGSGIELDKKGTILTNAHVVDGASKVTVQFENQKTVDATVIGKDLSTDLAILKVVPPSDVTLDPLTLGDSSNVEVGDPTVAIGNPFGLARTLTTGVVSALQRQITAPNGFSIDNVIQTDAPINPGNSGGPLIDATGSVIGINSQIETGGSGDGSVGIGFAVPSNTAKQVIPQLEKTGSISHAYLGVSIVPIGPTLAGLNLPVASGALVQAVTSGSPAAKAGLVAGNIAAQVDGNTVELGGDIILSVDDKPIATADDLTNLITGYKVGQTVTLGVLRDHKHINIKVQLANRPNTVVAGEGG